MCGIAGFVCDAPPSGPEAVLARMTAAIAHRGPDDSNFYFGPRAFLGHRRLSIIDLSGGHQPMSNEDRSLWIVYNGEIFNHADLRPASRSAPAIATEAAAIPKPSCTPTNNTAPIASAASAACSPSPSGTPTPQRLFCARDRLGIKPFYYFWDGRCSPSPPKSRRSSNTPPSRPRLDESLLPEYLAFGYVERRADPVSRHPQADARPSPDARLLRPRPGARDPSILGRPSALDPADSRAVQRRGLDRRMPPPPGGNRAHAPDERRPARHVPERRRRFERHRRPHEAHAPPARSRPSRSATARPRYSELSYARQVAARHRHRPPRNRRRHGRFLQRPAAPHLARGRAHHLAFQRLARTSFPRLAAKHVKVVLTGEGSDELFGGYDRYRWNLLNRRAASAYSLVPHPLRRFLRERIASTSLLSRLAPPPATHLSRPRFQHRIALPRQFLLRVFARRTEPPARTARPPPSTATTSTIGTPAPAIRNWPVCCTPTRRPISSNCS